MTVRPPSSVRMISPALLKALFGTFGKNASKIVKVRLTIAVSAKRALDGLGATHHCALVMNGLNHICGICREIIS